MGCIRRSERSWMKRLTGWGVRRLSQLRRIEGIWTTSESLKVAKERVFISIQTSPRAVGTRWARETDRLFRWNYSGAFIHQFCFVPSDQSPLGLTSRLDTYHEVCINCAVVRAASTSLPRVSTKCTIFTDSI